MTPSFRFLLNAGGTVRLNFPLKLAHMLLRREMGKPLRRSGNGRGSPPCLPLNLPRQPSKRRTLEEFTANQGIIALCIASLGLRPSMDSLSRGEGWQTK